MKQTRSTWLVVLAIIAALVVGGCRRAAPGDTGSAPPPTSRAAIASSIPRLCDASEPSHDEPFPFNRDEQSRDTLLRTTQLASVPGSMTYIGGTADFYSIDVATVAQLIADRYLDPYDRQNEAPTAWQIFRFMCLHPTVHASGYVVSIDRGDYRTTLDDIAAADLTPELQTAATAFCTTADMEMTGSLECFWD